jgi:hypothetical protein
MFATTEIRAPDIYEGTHQLGTSTCSFWSVAVSLRYGDGQGDDKAAFAREARRRHSHPLPKLTEDFVTWYCAKCGRGFAVQDVRIDVEANLPVCPQQCGGAGWETVQPHHFIL